MVYLVRRVWVPPSKGLEIIKLYAEVGKTFDWDKYGKVAEPILPQILIPTKDGVVGLSVIKVEKGKLEDALSLSTEWFTKAMNIEGYNFQFDLAYDAEDALSMTGINLAPPE
ncbi:MAG: hypothetical protein ACFFCS_28575 [Candidatus Hodarchaeota archaeon]